MIGEIVKDEGGGKWKYTDRFYFQDCLYLWLSFCTGQMVGGLACDDNGRGGRSEGWLGLPPTWYYSW